MDIRYKQDQDEKLCGVLKWQQAIPKGHEQ